MNISPKELQEIRSERFRQGKCPICDREADFRHSGTKKEGNHKFRVYRCSKCGGTFRVHVKTEISFCKVTRAGEGMTL